MGIPVLKDVFCMSLKTGCLIIGVLGLIAPIMTLFALAIVALLAALFTSVYSTQKQLIHESELGNENTKVSQQIRDSLEETDDFAKTLATVVLVATIIYAIICIGQIVVSSCLIHGARKGNAGLLLPWLVWVIIALFLFIVNLIFSIVMISLTGYAFKNLYATIFWAGLAGFFWVVVYSHRKELSEPHHATQNEMANRAGGVIHAKA